MRRIVRGLPRNRATIYQRMCETRGIRGRIEKHDRFERLEPEARGHDYIPGCFCIAPTVNGWPAMVAWWVAASTGAGA